MSASTSSAVTSTMLLPVLSLLLSNLTTISSLLYFYYNCFLLTFIDKDQEQFTKQLLYYLGAFVGGIRVSTILLHFLRYSISISISSANSYLSSFEKQFPAMLFSIVHNLT